MLNLHSPFGHFSGVLNVSTQKINLHMNGIGRCAAVPPEAAGKTKDGLPVKCPLSVVLIKGLACYLQLHQHRDTSNTIEMRR